MNKFPVVYALIPYKEACRSIWGPHEDDIIYEPFHYIVQKVYLVGMNIKYAHDGKAKKVYHVVNPLREVKGSIPTVWYREKSIRVNDYEVVDQIFLNLDDAMIAKENKNKIIEKDPFYNYVSKEYLDERMVACEHYEKAYLESLNDLSVGIQKDDNYRYDESETYFLDSDGTRKRAKPEDYIIRV